MRIRVVIIQLIVKLKWKSNLDELHFKKYISETERKYWILYISKPDTYKPAILV